MTAEAKKPKAQKATADKKGVAKKRGRPSLFTAQIADEICKRISEGQTLREICRLQKMPAWQTVYDWLRDDEDFSRRIARAREIGHDAIAEETLAILDQKPEYTPTEHGVKVDAGHVQWQKNRAEQRLKLLAKWNPQKYGDRLQLDANVELSLEQVDSKLNALFAKAQKDGSE